jgi:hypothetical protein
MSFALKHTLEDLLRARRLQADAPPLRGQDRRLSPLPTGVAVVDELLGGGLPRGQVSEVHGPPSAGRTGLVLALASRVTRAGTLAGWVDPRDRFDPGTAAGAGLDLARLLWLRGKAGQPRMLPEAVAATGTLVGSGLFDLVVLDLAGVPAVEIQRLPGATWIRLQRMIESTPVALVLIGDAHVAHGPGGACLAAAPGPAAWSGPPGPGRLLRGLATELCAGRHALRPVAFERTALYELGGASGAPPRPPARSAGVDPAPLAALV